MKKKVIWFSLGLLVCLVLLGIVVIRTFVYPIKFKQQIILYSQKYNLDPYLVLAVIDTESGFNEMATSHKDAKGLMQITESTAQEINEIINSSDNINDSTIYNENVNIDIGCMYLASLIERYKGNYYLALCSYNAGIGNVNKWLANNVIPSNLDTCDVNLPFKETSKYLKKVISSYKIYKLLYPTLA